MTTSTFTLDEAATRALDVLRDQALSRGMSLERYLLMLADVVRERAIAPPSPHGLTFFQFRDTLEELSASLPSLPALPADLSRADFYDDHD